MIDLDAPLEQIRDAAEHAFAKVGNDPNRIGELNDDDLTSVALHLKTQRPIAEDALIVLCGGVDQANAALKRVGEYPQGKLVKLVRAAYRAMKTHRNPSVGQFASFVYNLHVGVGAVMVEQERRQAKRAGRVN